MNPLGVRAVKDWLLTFVDQVACTENCFALQEVFGVATATSLLQNDPKWLKITQRLVSDRSQGGHEVVTQSYHKVVTSNRKHSVTLR